MTDLERVAMTLYLSGKWECKNINAKAQAELWKELRIALNIKKGTATKLNIEG